MFSCLITFYLKCADCNCIWRKVSEKSLKWLIHKPNFIFCSISEKNLVSTTNSGSIWAFCVENPNWAKTCQGGRNRVGFDVNRTFNFGSILASLLYSVFSRLSGLGIEGRVADLARPRWKCLSVPRGTPPALTHLNSPTQLKVSNL